MQFDDFKVTHTKSNLIQGNACPPKLQRRREYYPFGLQTANSWTRESVTGNNYLANGGTELNATSQLYDLMFRNYDPALGRMFQVDPMASKYGSITPYNYSLNNPSNMNDPLGDDVEPQPPTPREYICAMCWREGNDLTNYMRVSGGGSFGYGWGGYSGGGFYGGSGSMGKYWHPGDGRMFWSGYEVEQRQLRGDADAVRYGDMSLSQFARNHPGSSITVSELRAMADLHNAGVNPITGERYNSNSSSTWYGGGRYTSSKTGITYSEKKGTVAGNALRILGSFIATDKNKTLAGKILQVLSRFTWELPQQVIGVLIAQSVNVVGGIKNAYSMNGALILESKFIGPEVGYTMGNVITVGLGSSPSTISHEYGHYIQSRMLGPLYTPFVVPQSLIWATGYGMGLFGIDYERFYIEGWSTQLGNRFWNDR